MTRTLPQRRTIDRFRRAGRRIMRAFVWVPLRDLKKARAERDMNIRNSIELERILEEHGIEHELW